MTEPTSLRAWPPYLIAVVTFLVTVVVSIIFVGAYVLVSAWDPNVPFDEIMNRVMASGDASPSVLILSVVVTSISLSAMALAATMPAENVASRMRLFRVSPMDAIAATIGVLGLGMMLDTLVAWLGLDNRGSLASIRDTLGTLSTGKLLVAGVFIGVFPGIGEELFFRGYLMRRMQAAQGTVVALLASSVIFGMFHTDPVHSPTAALIGLYLGVMVLWTGSLWVGVVGHSVNNFVAAITVNHTLDREQGTIWLLIGLNAAYVAGWYVWRRHRRFKGGSFW